jgi:hypothetical protein
LLSIFAEEGHGVTYVLEVSDIHQLNMVTSALTLPNPKQLIVINATEEHIEITHDETSTPIWVIDVDTRLKACRSLTLLGIDSDSIFNIQPLDPVVWIPSLSSVRLTNARARLLLDTLLSSGGKHVVGTAVEHLSSHSTKHLSRSTAPRTLSLQTHRAQCIKTDRPIALMGWHLHKLASYDVPNTTPPRITDSIALNMALDSLGIARICSRELAW